jgi:hypothetical protein
MRQIEKLPQIKIISEYRGSSFVYLIYIGIPIFAIAGLFMAYNGLNDGKFINIFYGLLSILFFGAVGVSVFKGGVYEPEKTFFMERMNKEKLNKYIIYSAIAMILFCLICFLLDGKFGVIGGTIVGFIGLYNWSKSIKFHEDVDYEANEFIADLIGLSVDEKIVASYQNFDSSKSNRKKNDNLIVVTNRKIFFAVYSGTNWMTLNKLLSEIVKIGIARNDVNSYLKLVFEDNTSLGLRLDLYEKITTTPQLFVKQFLSTLDASLLCYDIVSSNNRRRVSISNENTTLANNFGNQTRSIEINPTLVSELKASEEIKSGRILEI